MTEEIKFGTDGWRGLIAKDFTFDNISLVAAATGEQFLEDLKTKKNVKNQVFIGYDRRFLGKEFSKRVAEILTSKGLNVNLYNTDVPTPMVSFDVKKNNSVGGIVITASHNPAQFSGFKIKMSSGASASKDYTSKIENRLKTANVPEIKSGKDPKFNLIDPSKEYISYIEKTLDIQKLKMLKEKIIVDPMHGTGNGYIEKLLSGGNLDIKTIRGNIDFNFGGVNPEPMMPQLLPLSNEVQNQKAFLGLATDGDADRVGAVDERGNYINTHKLLAILLYYLVEKKRLSGGVVVTFSQSVLVKKMAKKYGLKLYEVPIGFKYIADLMLKEDILIGGEEANGIGSKLAFMPDRDGIFNSILVLEAIASFGLKSSELINKLNGEFGTFYYDRVDVHIPSTSFGREFIEQVKSKPPREVNGLKVKEVQDLDGTKLIFEDESWLLFRGSGTEPLLRIYSEALSKKSVEDNLKYGEDLFRERSKVTC